MSKPRKTYVLITIDAENSLKFENGCWSYCVNGHFPEDLDALVRGGLAERTPNGYRLHKGYYPAIREYRDFDSDEPTSACTAPVAERIEKAEAGLPLIFRSMSRVGAPCVVFLDTTGLYRYGRREFRESVDLIIQAGHDLQMHIHPETLYPQWFEERGVPSPTAEDKARGTQFWPYDIVHRLHRVVTDDLASFKGERPIAYRAGAYRISDSIIQTLVELGYLFDSSYDILNIKGHVSIGGGGKLNNAAVRYGGLVELPITAYTWGRPSRTVRFVANRNAYDRVVMLERMHEMGIRVITYILHSYSMMKVYGSAEEPNAKVGRLGPDALIVEHFDRELEFMSQHEGFEIVDTTTLKTRIDEDPSILEGDGTIPSIRGKRSLLGFGR